jgi:predicted RNA-binding protein (virulence factor B family)
MLQIGKFNQLKVVNQLPFGFQLDGGVFGHVLLRHIDTPEDCKVGDVLNVFVYHDSDDRLVATFNKPYAQINECAVLRVAAVNKVGAFLDWGLDKDLLLPFNEQEKPVSEGMSVVVYVFYDDATERVVASAKLRDFLNEDGSDLTTKQSAELIVYAQTDMGYKAVINKTHLGLIYKDEAFKKLRVGQRIKGFIKHIREDKKIDLSVQLHDDQARKSLAEQIIEDLEAHGGISTLTDKSPAEEIYQRFNVSKNAYKKALGGLYKSKRIKLDKTKVVLL